MVVGDDDDDGIREVDVARREVLVGACDGDVTCRLCSGLMGFSWLAMAIVAKVEIRMKRILN